MKPATAPPRTVFVGGCAMTEAEHARLEHGVLFRISKGGVERRSARTGRLLRGPLPSVAAQLRRIRRERNSDD